MVPESTHEVQASANPRTVSAVLAPANVPHDNTILLETSKNVYLRNHSFTFCVDTVATLLFFLLSSKLIIWFCHRKQKEYGHQRVTFVGKLFI